MALFIGPDDNPQHVFDHHFTLKCPRCAAVSNITAVSIPRFAYLSRFKPERVGVVYRCDACNEPIFLRFKGVFDGTNSRFVLHVPYEEVERPTESFEFSYLPDGVGADFREALTCYSTSCFNAFAAMCRRTVQSVAGDLGVQGTSKVMAQLDDLKAMAQIDDETFRLLKQIVIDGHDGAHPHLPALSPDRAAVLLELMKDVLYQLFVRKGKLKQAMAMRVAAIAEKKKGS